MSETAGPWCKSSSLSWWCHTYHPKVMSCPALLYIYTHTMYLTDTTTNDLRDTAVVSFLVHPCPLRSAREFDFPRVQSLTGVLRIPWATSRNGNNNNFEPSNYTGKKKIEEGSKEKPLECGRISLPHTHVHPHLLPPLYPNSPTSSNLKVDLKWAFCGFHVTFFSELSGIWRWVWKDKRKKLRRW